MDDCKVISILKQINVNDKKKQEIKESKVEKGNIFSDSIRRNKESYERRCKERLTSNRAVLRSYRIKS